MSIWEERKKWEGASYNHPLLPRRPHLYGRSLISAAVKES